MSVMFQDVIALMFASLRQRTYLLAPYAPSFLYTILFSLAVDNFNSCCTQVVDFIKRCWEEMDDTGRSIKCYFRPFVCVCESLSDAQFRDKCDGNCGWKENGCTGLFMLKTCQLHYGIKISIFGKCIVDCFLAMYFIHFFSILKKLGFYWSETNNLDVKRQLKSSAELHDII